MRTSTERAIVITIASLFGLVMVLGVELGRSRDNEHTADVTITRLTLENMALKSARKEWTPTIGETVHNRYGESNTVAVVTNVVQVGRDRSQTGKLVYGEGMPGIDSSWVSPLVRPQTPGGAK